MKILFVCFGQLGQGDGELTSPMASMRYRALIPARALGRRGYEVRVVVTGQGDWSDAEVTGLACDVAVISKSFNDSTESLARKLRERGTRIVVDVCDSHFDHPEFGGVFGRLVALGDTLTASTPAMAAVIAARTGREALVVSDPVEGPRGEARFSPRFPVLRLTWFGNAQSAASLEARVPELLELSKYLPVRLAVVTAGIPQVLALVERINQEGKPRVQALHAPWSADATWDFLRESDVVWITQGTDEAAQVKSPNRLLEGLWAGRLVVADDVPAYRPFAPFARVGQGLVKGVLGALNHPGKAEEAIRAGQRQVARDHSAFAIGERWGLALGQAPAPLRLNLGCGDKILPGFVNVDIVAMRAGARPDVICDLHDLAPFADASADEVMAIHVVEHFWRWDVEAVLREWIRVLKPGGRLVVECPNLASAAREFLANPVEGAREGPEGQRTMWVYYGDPKWRDPLMVHRWGYTPASLAELLAAVGLEAVRQEPAQYKLREPRDMRVVGVKSSSVPPPAASP